ncbi:Enamine deaminase RidA, house cleaning of reactive enamine intermediates, YjgF/YER057c/UK114 family [Arenibacter troitsensis]|uniref:Enamine deaminase RidA, house cleaning of reactive enamine intermediates, YjgF/YER057c/UK114 family n=2 Tax=Arenibacter troitsensis TaxID=188872 RepID=A0A1X7IQD9_9FLAO|nr:Enamine deaminase RidA, house cleaning of reactive enamine intermediates, YjgF/YER057c/UK114 family [Arenibacter troitsensis]
MIGRIVSLGTLTFLLACTNSTNPNPKKNIVMTTVKNSFINPKGLFNPTYNGFSHIVKVPEGKEIYYFSGQWASNLEGKLVSENFEEQVKQTVSNVKTALETAGLSLDDVVKQTVYIVDFTTEKKQTLIDIASKEWRVKNFPASTIVPLPLLATAPNCKIEIEIIAAK